MAKQSTLSFFGGAGSVTGSNFLLKDTETGFSFLIDCGLFQGCRFCEDENRKPFAYNPASIDVLFVTHSHIDHVGRIPKLVHEGFKGKIFSTPATRDLAEVMLIDSMGVLGKEAKHQNLPPLYSEEDVRNTMSLWETKMYGEQFTLGPGFTVSFHDAGHILGSTMVRMEREGRVLMLTGDLGNSPAPILKNTEKVTGVHYLVMESVYGDRNHESVEDRKKKLEEVIEETIKRKGALIVPAFSLERTQLLLYEINNLVENGRIPSVPVYLDSPLAIAITDIYKKHESYFNTTAQALIKKGDDIFNFPELRRTKTTEESKAIANSANPKVIIAGSGMSNGGRIVHHEKRHLPEKESTLLLVGYQAAGTLGRALEEGAKTVSIHGEEIPVLAHVERIRGFSAHKDSLGLQEFVADMSESLEKVFLAMGEPKASLFLAQRLRDYLGVNAVVPEEGDEVRLEL